MYSKRTVTLAESILYCNIFMTTLFNMFNKPFPHNMHDLKLYYLCGDTI